MQMNFIPAPVPELTLSGEKLPQYGFAPGTPIKLLFKDAALWITPVNDDAIWQALCEATQFDSTLGADWVRDNGDISIGGDWLTDIDISGLEQLEITYAPTIIKIQRRTGVFQA